MDHRNSCSPRGQSAPGRFRSCRTTALLSSSYHGMARGSSYSRILTRWPCPPVSARHIRNFVLGTRHGEDNAVLFEPFSTTYIIITFATAYAEARPAHRGLNPICLDSVEEVSVFGRKFKPQTYMVFSPFVGRSTTMKSSPTMKWSSGDSSLGIDLMSERRNDSLLPI